MTVMSGARLKNAIKLTKKNKVNASTQHVKLFGIANIAIKSSAGENKIPQHINVENGHALSVGSQWWESISAIKGPSHPKTPQSLSMCITISRHDKMKEKNVKKASSLTHRNDVTNVMGKHTNASHVLNVKIVTTLGVVS